MPDIYTQFDTQGDYDAYLIAGGFPKRGNNRGKPAGDDKQMTVCPYPAEVGTGGKEVIKSEAAIDFASSVEITKAEAQALGIFPDTDPDPALEGV